MYRYQHTFVTLTYKNQESHNKNNITKLIDYLNKQFKDANGDKIPLHYIWKLEHRRGKSKEDKATGYHYHLSLLFNKDIYGSNYKLNSLIKRYWEKHNGGAWESSNKNTRSIPQLIERVKTSYVTRNIEPTYNTNTTSKYGLFHHLTYLTKEDATQLLPETYKGKSFGMSQMKENKLNDNPEIKEHKLTTTIQPDWLDDYSTTIISNEEMQEQFNKALPF